MCRFELIDNTGGVAGAEGRKASEGELLTHIELLAAVGAIVRRMDARAGDVIDV